MPVLKVRDSDQLKVGETVLAVGAPSGLNQTVTSGILSAVDRVDVGIADYEDFIRTDAALPYFYALATRNLCHIHIEAANCVDTDC